MASHPQKQHAAPPVDPAESAADFAPMVLARLGHGAKPGEIEALRQAGYRAWLDEHFGPSRFTWRTMVMSPYVLTTSVRETQVDRWTIMSSIAYGSRG